MFLTYWQIRYLDLKMTELDRLQANKQDFSKSTKYYISWQYSVFLPLRNKTTLAPQIFELDLKIFLQMKIESKF